MAKLYSEKLNKYYEMNEAELLAQEEAAYDAEMAEIEKKKVDKETRLREVEAAYDTAYKAHIEALRLKDKYVADYGVVHIKKTFDIEHVHNPFALMTSLYSLFDL